MQGPDHLHVISTRRLHVVGQARKAGCLVQRKRTPADALSNRAYAQGSQAGVVVIELLPVPVGPV